MEFSEVSLSEFLRKKEAFLKKMEAGKKAIQPDLLGFLIALGMESERSAVVLGAERINVAVESLLKNFLRPSTNKKDELFTSQGSLAAFSKKIEMAYRLGLIDLKMRQALDMVRNLRNDFAHATTVESLQDQKHADRVKALWKLMMKGNQSVAESFADAFQRAAKEGGATLADEAARYLSCVMQLLVKLELVRHHIERPDVVLPAKINFEDPD